jgi:hypothetical protein
MGAGLEVHAGELERGGDLGGARVIAAVDGGGGGGVRGGGADVAGQAGDVGPGGVRVDVERVHEQHVLAPGEHTEAWARALAGWGGLPV